MRLSQKLRQELKLIPQGTYAPYYFRYQGVKENLDKSTPLLRAHGVKSLFSKVNPFIYKNDLIVGSYYGAYVEADDFLLRYAKTTVDKIGERDFITNFDHFSPDYKKIVSVGIPALIMEIDESVKNHKNDKEKCETLLSMRLTLEGFLDMIENYIILAKSLKDTDGFSNDNLSFIISNLSQILKGAPETFSQALNLVWLCHTAFYLEGRCAMALGRMDQYLYPFYKKDIDMGLLDDEKVIELLENTYTKIPTNEVVNICIGGQDKDGNCEVNQLSYLIINAVKNCNAPGPNLSARITKNTPDLFLDEALKSIGTGLGYPALMNDDINIKALKNYGYDEDDVYDYSFVGCIENFITGKQPPWSDDRFDAPRFFDYLFFNGISKHNNSVGPDMGDVKDIKSMDEFMRRYEKLLEFGAAQYVANFNTQNNSINQKYFSDPFISCFCDGCIKKGMDIHSGGSKYPSVHGAACMGIGTVTDSLSAIEKVVFIDKKATLTDIKNAIDANFKGYEDLRELLIKAPKYGNDDDFADKYAVWFTNYVTSLFKNYKTFDGGGIYVAMAANIENISAGKVINATPDGRLKGEPLSDAASPTYGKDVLGPTATLNSVTKPDYSLIACGSVINQKFSPSMFNNINRKKILSLIKVYFQRGGQEIQINATSREVLKDAMKNPEKYQNLVVRVSGFSDYYVRLSKDVQLDILSRTQQS